MSSSSNPVVYEAKAPHEHTYITITFAPTETEYGYTAHICEACGDYYETDIVPATGNTGSEDPTDPVDPSDPTDPADPSKPTGSNGSAADTGDDSMMVMWLGLALFAIAGTTTLIGYRKRWI